MPDSDSDADDCFPPPVKTRWHYCVPDDAVLRESDPDLDWGDSVAVLKQMIDIGRRVSAAVRFTENGYGPDMPESVRVEVTEIDGDGDGGLVAFIAIADRKVCVRPLVSVVKRVSFDPVGDLSVVIDDSLRVVIGYEDRE